MHPAIAAIAIEIGIPKMAARIIAAKKLPVSTHK
jgi:hypothetical protein